MNNQLYTFESKFSDQVVDATRSLPTPLAKALYKIYSSESYFKRLHCVSDLLIGFLRLYGYSLISILENNGYDFSSNKEILENLEEKDSHGLWCHFIKLILNNQNSDSELMFPNLSSVFGVKLKGIKQPKIHKLKVQNNVVDYSGKTIFTTITV